MTAEIHALVDAIRESHAHIERSLAAFTDELARGDSLLPGWTRGHVATHIARNADALVNLTVWVRTGVRTPMYPSREARAEAIEAQAGRPAAEIIADVQASNRRLIAAVDGLSEEDWAKSYGDPGEEEPAVDILLRRRTEAEVHHVDLDLDYTLAHWPEDFVEYLLADTAQRYTEQGRTPGFVLVGNDDEGTWTVGSGGQLITGPPPALLGWLIGRTTGIGLHSDEPLPQLGAWK
jgi:maleylpyruvate isomerase